MSKSLIAAFAALGLCAAGPAQAAPAARCLTPAEMRGLIGYFLPDVIGQVAKTCAAHLPAGSYLRTGLPRIGAELAARKPANWPVARSAFLKMSDTADAKKMASLPEATLRPLVDAEIAAKLNIPVTPAACGEVNDIAEALAPLSADQTITLMATIFSAVARKDAKLRSCPREQNP
jgi:hypothetical protein